jgi:hypothetical protein
MLLSMSQLTSLVEINKDSYIHHKMDLKTLLSVGICTVITILTILFWREYLVSSRSKEGFTTASTMMSNSALSDQVIKMISANNESVPSSEEVAAAHQTLLRFIRDDYSQGVKIVMDFRDRFMEPGSAIRTDIDVRRLLDNYHSPLQRL